MLPSQCANPQPLPEAMIRAGQARVTLLSPRLLRLEWSPDAIFDDRASFAFPNRRVEPAPPARIHRRAETTVIDTGELRLTLRDDGQPFHRGNLSITYALEGGERTWHPGDPPDGNLGSTRRDLDNTWRPLDARPGILSRDGWAVIDDGGTFRFGPGGAEQGWAEPPLPASDPPRLDWYFFGHGRDYLGALADFARFSGAPALPPRYTWGAWWSRYWPYRADELIAIADDFKRHGLPLDVVVIDMDWHTQDSWTGYTWDRTLYPDPPALLRALHRRGLRTTLNLHPAMGVQAHEAIYPEFARTLGLEADSGDAIPFTLADPQFAESYFELLHRPREAEGVDFWWIDWQQGTESELPGLDPLAWLNHLHFRDLRRDGRRALILSRWPGFGGQRTPVAFSGDAAAGWPELAFQLQYTAQAAGAGALFWSHDIGGHFGGDNPELFTRWVQFGALSPVLRLHGSRDPRSERLPWKFGDEALAAAREAFQLRYRLLPYIEDMAREATRRGVPLCRPMVLEWPEESDAYLAREQYQFGDRLLAAPLVRPRDRATGLATGDVWLPPGIWIDAQTLEQHQGPGWRRTVGDLMRLPLFVRAGAIVPLAPPMQSTAEMPMDHVILEIWPCADGCWTLGQDDGLSENAEANPTEETLATLAWERNGCTLSISPVSLRNALLPEERSLELHFRGVHAPRHVEIAVGHDALSDDETTTRYDKEHLTFVLRLPPLAKALPVEVHLRHDRALCAMTAGRAESQARADAIRLLETDHPDLAESEESITPDWIAALPGRAAADALARMGGPATHLIANTTPGTASATLGHLAVHAPRDGGSHALQCQWTLNTRGKVQRIDSEAPVAHDDRILAAPFALRSPERPSLLSVRGTIEWRGFSLAFHHQAPAILPAIAVWHFAVVPPQTPLEAAFDSAGNLSPEWQWETHRLDPARLANLCDWFHPAWPGAFWAEADDAEKPHVLAVARIISPNPAKARLCLGDPATELRPVSRAHFQWNRASIPLSASKRAVDVEIAEGFNTLTARIHLASHEYLAAALFDLDGLPLTALVYE